MAKRPAWPSSQSGHAQRSLARLVVVVEEQEGDRLRPVEERHSLFSSSHFASKSLSVSFSALVNLISDAFPVVASFSFSCNGFCTVGPSFAATIPDVVAASPAGADGSDATAADETADPPPDLAVAATGADESGPPAVDVAVATAVVATGANRGGPPIAATIPPAVDFAVMAAVVATGAGSRGGPPAEKVTPPGAVGVSAAAFAASSVDGSGPPIASTITSLVAAAAAAAVSAGVAPGGTRNSIEYELVFEYVGVDFHVSALIPVAPATPVMGGNGSGLPP